MRVLVEPDPKRELLHQSYLLQLEAALFFRALLSELRLSLTLIGSLVVTPDIANLKPTPGFRSI